MMNGTTKEDCFPAFEKFAATLPEVQTTPMDIAIAAEIMAAMMNSFSGIKGAKPMHVVLAVATLNAAVSEP